MCSVRASIIGSVAILFGFQQVSPQPLAQAFAFRHYRLTLPHDHHAPAKGRFAIGSFRCTILIAREVRTVVSNPMHLVYLDESGNTGTDLKDKQQPIFVLAALIVSET
jgi:hypothetical protein